MVLNSQPDYSKSCAKSAWNFRRNNHDSQYDLPKSTLPWQPGRFSFILLALAILVLAMIKVIVLPHAYAAHGADAEQTRNCIQQNGVWKAHREPKSNTFHWLCQDPATGTIFDMIVEKLRRQNIGKRPLQPQTL